MVAIQPIETERITLHNVDALEYLGNQDDNTIDSAVIDPPYGLGKVPPIRDVLACWLDGDEYEAKGGGFMGHAWDAFVPGPRIWSELCRVLKPGSYAVVFAGQRTADLMGIALRLGGFEVRDLGAWQYWSGFPKSLNLPGGLGTALKPSLEPWLLVRVPFAGTVSDNVARWGTGAINIDACRYGYGDPAWPGPCDGQPIRYDNGSGGSFGYSGPNEANDQKLRSEPWVNDLGRWPANVYACPKPSTHEREAGCEGLKQRTAGELTGGRAEGSAGLDNPRAGAGRTSDGRGNSHSTVKPVRLIRWLQRLVTPRDGLTIDTHCGKRDSADRGPSQKACAPWVARYQRSIARSRGLGLGTGLDKDGSICGRVSVHTSGLRSAGYGSSLFINASNKGLSRRVGSPAPPLARMATRALSWGPPGRECVRWSIYSSHSGKLQPYWTPGSILSTPTLAGRVP